MERKARPRFQTENSPGQRESRESKRALAPLHPASNAPPKVKEEGPGTPLPAPPHGSSQAGGAQVRGRHPETATEFMRRLWSPSDRVGAPGVGF